MGPGRRRNRDRDGTQSNGTLKDRGRIGIRMETLPSAPRQWDPNV